MQQTSCLGFTLAPPRGLRLYAEIVRQTAACDSDLIIIRGMLRSQKQECAAIPKGFFGVGGACKQGSQLCLLLSRKDGRTT